MINMIIIGINQFIYIIKYESIIVKVALLIIKRKKNNDDWFIQNKLKINRNTLSYNLI